MEAGCRRVLLRISRVDAIHLGRQATAEGATYDEEGLLRLLRLARIGTDQIFAAQAAAVAK